MRDGTERLLYLQQPYLRALGVPVALFGVVFAATKVVTALVASSAWRMDAAGGPVATAALVGGVPAVGLGLMGVVTAPAGALLLLTRGVLDGLWQPLTNVYLNRLVSSRLRATMLSLQSLIARLALALGLLGAGVAALGVEPTLRRAALAALVAGVLLVASGARAPAILAAPGPCDSRKG